MLDIFFINNISLIVNLLGLILLDHCTAMIFCHKWMISSTENDRKNEAMGENRESGQYRPLHWDVLYFDGNTKIE